MESCKCTGDRPIQIASGYIICGVCKLRLAPVTVGPDDPDEWRECESCEELQARVKSLEADVEHLTYANMQMAPQLVRLRARNKELREGADTPSDSEKGGE